jgi:hypothetical protein
MVEKKEGVSQPKEETKKEVEKKWSVEAVPTQFEPGIVIGDKVLTLQEAIAEIGNNIEDIKDYLKRVVGNA